MLQPQPQPLVENTDNGIKKIALYRSRKFGGKRLKRLSPNRTFNLPWMAAKCAMIRKLWDISRTLTVGGLVQPLTQASVPISQKGKWRQSEHPLLKPGGYWGFELVVCFETGSHSVTMANLELKILLPQAPKWRLTSMCHMGGELTPTPCLSVHLK